MAKKYIDVDALIEDWIEVSAEENSVAFSAWERFRRSLRCYFVPKSYTVPTLFPPTTVAEVNKYIAVCVDIRKSIGWNNQRARFPENVSPWHG